MATYPHLDRLEQRVQAALGSSASPGAIAEHVHRLAGESSAYQDAYCAALAPKAVPERRQDADAEQRVDAKAAAARFRRETEDAWRRPTLGMRRSDGQFASPEVAAVTVTGTGATAPGGKLGSPSDAIPKDAGWHPLHSHPTSEPADEDLRAAEHLRRLENLWRLPLSVGMSKSDL